MKTRLLRLASLLLAIALFGAACGGDDDTSTVDAVTDAVDATDTGTNTDANGNDDADDGDTSDNNDGDATSNDAVADTDGAADTDGVTDPDGATDITEADTDTDDVPVEVRADEEVFVGLARNVFNIEPTTEHQECLVAEMATDDEWTSTIRGLGDGSRQLEDTELRHVTFMMNGCVDTESLGDWATQAVGSVGEARDNGPACFASRFDGDNGDAVFHSFTALTLQYRLDPAVSDDVTDMLVSCAPVVSLADFFAGNAETATNFETVVNRECFSSAIDNDETSTEFWNLLVSGQGPPDTALAPFIEECSTEFVSELAAELPAGWEPWTGDGALALVETAARAGIYSAPPPMTIDPAKSYEAVFNTGGGEIRIKLLADTAPNTVNNFVNLARDGYYDGTIFHRVLADFMAQGGDPTGTGSGGPGYQFGDEVDDGPALDRPGLLAMANSGPATNGSQFFITTVATDWLTGLHTVFGEVIEGQDLVDNIELRDPASPTSRGQSLDTVVIIES